MTAAELYTLLRRRYPAERYALLPQVRNGTVRNGTGFSRRVVRTADAVAVGLWPSRGLEVEGFEIKVDRRDWLRELARPDKAEEIAGYCDRWWIVAPDMSICPSDEIPSAWGLLLPVRGSLQAARAASKLDPKPLDRSFVAALLRKAASTHTTDAALDAARDAGYASGYEVGVREQKGSAEHARRQLEEHRQTVAEFEQAAGVRVLDPWNHGSIAAHVAAARDVDTLRDRLKQTAATAERIAADARRHLASFGEQP